MDIIELDFLSGLYPEIIEVCFYVSFFIVRTKRGEKFCKEQVNIIILVQSSRCFVDRLLGLKVLESSSGEK